MIEWIKNNKEWLFSGAGIAAITLIIFILRHLYNAKKKKGAITKKDTYSAEDETIVPSTGVHPPTSLASVPMLAAFPVG